MRALVLLAAALAACGGPSTPAAPVAPASSAKPAVSSACPDKRPTNASDAPKGADALAGAHVDRVCIVGGSEAARAAVARAVGTKEGVLLDAKRVHDDLVAIIGLPAIADAWVYATKTPAGGVTVIYAVEERPLITEVVYDGVHSFAQSELHPGPMQEGKPFDTAVVKMFVTAFTEAYKERGFGNANVAVASEPAGEGRVRVRVTVTEGPKWRFGKVDFRGRSKGVEGELLSAAQLEAGSTFDEDRLERAALLLNAWYYDHGMVNARVEAQHAAPGPDGLVPITFSVQEGDVFTIKSIAVEGVPAAEQRTLLAEVTGKPKRMFVRSTIVEDLRRVRLRAEKLHPRADVEVEPLTDVDPKTKTVTLRFQVVVRDR